MPGRAAEPGGALVPFSPGAAAGDVPAVHRVRHGLAVPISRIAISWSRGNVLAISYFSPSPADDAPGGRVVEVDLGGGEDGGDAAERRRVAYGSLPAFTLLQNKRNSMLVLSRMSSFHEEWYTFLESSF